MLQILIQSNAVLLCVLCVWVYFCIFLQELMYFLQRHIHYCISFVTNFYSWKRFPGIEPSQLFTEFWPTQWLVTSSRFCELLLWLYLCASFINYNENMCFLKIFVVSITNQLILNLCKCFFFFYLFSLF